MKRRILNNKGESYIDVVVGVIAGMMVIVIALNIFSFLSIRQDLEYYCKEMVEVCCAYGKTCDEVQDRDEAIVEELGFAPNLSFEGTEYFNAKKRTVQYGETIVITVSYQTYVRGLGVFKIPVTLTVTQSGLSRRYWK